MRYKSKKAEAGIGTLILFIAMILVAAVAAGVLIATSNNLQTRALATGSQARDQVTTAVQFLNIYGDDASADNTLENFYVEMKLVSGSDIIKLSDGVFEFTLMDNASSLPFGSIGDCASPNSAASFEVEYLINGSQNIPEYLVSGDVVLICFQSPREVDEDEQVQFTFIPKTGALANTKVTTPSVMNEKTVYLFP